MITLTRTTPISPVSLYNLIGENVTLTLTDEATISGQVIQADSYGMMLWLATDVEVFITNAQITNITVKEA